MKHLMILFFILSLLTGTGVIIYTFQFSKKHNYQFLKHLTRYLIFFNLFMIIGLSYQYILVNMYDGDFDLIPSIISMVLFLFVFGAEFGITYSIFRFVTDLKEIPIKKIFNTLLIIWVSAFGSATLIGTFIYMKESTYELVYVIHEIWVFSMLIIILAMFLSLLLFTFKNKIWTIHKKKSVRIFSIYFILFYLYNAISELDFYFFKMNIDEYDPIFFLLINIWPFLWIKFYFDKYHTTSISESNDHQKMEMLFSKYKISVREQEIIHLIIVGKSNKEIEETLFISFNTVKNHIYNIFKKTGVTSRSQLMHLIQQSN